MSYLIIDLGTTYFKFSLIDRAGNLVHTSRLPTLVRRSDLGRCEIDVADFERTIAEGISSLAQQTGGLNDVDAITFATQSNSFVLLDENYQAITSIILWPDDRANGVPPSISQKNLPKLRAITGLPAVSGQFMVAKLEWLKQHDPEVWRKTHKLCLIGDYLTLLFTGMHVTELGAAGFTALVDIHNGQWWSEAISVLQLERAWLPEIVSAGTDLGTIRDRAAERFRLPRHCRFFVGCFDQYASPLGVGNFQSNIVSETTGTVLASVRCADQIAVDLDHTVFQGPRPADKGFFRMTFGDVAGNGLQRYRESLPDRPSFAELDELAATVPSGTAGMSWNDKHTRAQAVRCLLERVAWALAGQIRALSPVDHPTEIRSAGGGARSTLWLQIKADVLGLPTVATTCEEPTSLGVAMLAEARRSNASTAQLGDQWVKRGPVHEPNPQSHRVYQSLRPA